jgi:hypothetical protein
MDCAGFFADVESRVGIAAPLVDRPETRPAPWYSPDDQEEGWTVAQDRASVELLEPGARGSDPGPWPDDLYDPDFFFDSHGDYQWVDAIAVYRPWHVHREEWGIAIDELELGQFVASIATYAKLSPARLAPLVTRQVLAHENVHFSFEVAATEIEDLLGEPRYLAYLSGRFGGPNRWSSGPLEEVVATSAEIRFAESLPARGRGSAPRAYRDAVNAVNRLGPPGYCDFELMANPHYAERIVADTAALIANRDVWSPNWWPRVGPAETDQVPLYWRGDPSRLGLFGLGKTVAAPSIRRFEKWLYSVVGATRLKGTKHAKAELPNGVRVTYKDDGAELLPPEAQQIAQKVGLRNRRALYQYVADGREPPLYA